MTNADQMSADCSSDGPTSRRESTWDLVEGDPITPDLFAWDLLSVGPRFEMWAAWSIDRLTPVCVKLPRRDQLSEGVLGALRREQTATSAFAHPSIPRCFGFDLDARIPYLALEWVDGESLSDHISANGPMDDNDVLHAGLQTLAALRHIHTRGFVHHDVKPGNLMVRDGRIVVIDFDLALRAGALRSKTKPRGTHSWMSPEQIGCQPATPSMDLFALGAVLYRAASGISPFKNPDARRSLSASSAEPRVYVQLEGTRPPVAEVAPQLSPPVADAIEQMLQLDQRRRPATAEAAIDLLVRARPSEDEPLWPQWVSRKVRPTRPQANAASPGGRDVRTGSGAGRDFAQALSHDQRSSALVIVDGDLEHEPAVAEVLKIMATAPSSAKIAAKVGGDDTASLLELADRVTAADPAMIIAIGGGSIVDAARLATILALNRGGEIEALLEPGPTGITRLDVSALSMRPVIAMTTTIGTGAEVSPVACHTQDGVKRMLVGRQLQPSVGIIDPELTRSLPPKAIEQGLVEATLRYLGPFLFGASETPTAEEQAMVEMSGLAALLRSHRDIGLSDDQRLEAALRSANTRLGFALAGRDGYSAKLWYLATALTDLVDMSKVDAHLLLLPTLLRRVIDGDTRLGDRRQLAAAASALGVDGSSVDGSGVDGMSSSGIAQFLGRPAVLPATLAPAGAVAEHAAHYWGGDLPCLGAFSTVELTDFYAQAFVAATR